MLCTTVRCIQMGRLLLAHMIGYDVYVTFCCRRTVTDKTTGQKVVLSDQDVDLVTRLKQKKYVDPNFDPYQVRQQPIICCARYCLLAIQWKKLRKLHTGLPALFMTKII